MNNRIFTLLTGFVLGIVLTTAGLGLAYMARGFSKWGELQLTSDSDVRATMAGAGIKLPAGSHGLYFGQSGFVDSSIWIKFIVPQDQIWKVVEDSIQKKQSDFAPIFPEHLLVEIHQNKGQSYDLNWWQPKAITTPVSWSLHKEKDGQHYFEDWLIDMDTGTFYITKWDT